MIAPNTNRLAYFPVTLFGAIMGYSSLTLGVYKAHELFSLSAYFYMTLTVITTLLFTLFALVYGAKIIQYPASVKQEFQHPVSVHFFPTFSISLLLLSLLYKDIWFDFAQSLWYLGASLQFGLLIYILNNWIHQPRWQITHMNPAWFIPVVGNIIIPLGAPSFASTELGWFFFSIGLIFWVILNSIVMYRLFFHPPLLKVLEPTLFILIAPPAVGFLSYMTLIETADGQTLLDPIARVLYYIGLFMTLLLLSQSRRFFKVPFALSWWAYTFPIGAIALASFTMYQQLQIALYGYIGAFLLLILSGLVLHLTLKTGLAIKQQTLCRPPTEEPPSAN